MRSIGQPVRVSDQSDRYHGTRGFVCALVRGFGTTLYCVRGVRVKDDGEPVNDPAWECLFFPDQIRAVHGVGNSPEPKP